MRILFQSLGKEDGQMNKKTCDFELCRTIKLLGGVEAFDFFL